MTRSAGRPKALAAKTRKQFDLDDMPKPTKLKGKALADKARETFKKLRPKTQDELDLESMRGLQDQFPPKISEIPSEPKSRKQRVASSKEKTKTKPTEKKIEQPKKESGGAGGSWEPTKAVEKKKKKKQPNAGFETFAGFTATGHRPQR